MCSNNNKKVELDKDGECKDKEKGYDNFTDRVKNGVVKVLKKSSDMMS